MENKEWLTLKEASYIAGVSTDTIRRWADSGYIKSKRTEGEHRRIYFDSLKKYTYQKNKKKIKYALIYARVFKEEQRKELEKQVEKLEYYCAHNGWKYKIITSVSSGVDYENKNLNKLLNLITSERISRLVLNYSDNLFLFGNEIIFELCKLHNVEVIILSDDKSSLYKEELEEVLKNISKD